MIVFDEWASHIRPETWGQTAQEDAMTNHWRVTLHRGGVIDKRPTRVLYAGPDEGQALAAYHDYTSPPEPGAAVACWKPDGTLHASTKGPRKG